MNLYWHQSTDPPRHSISENQGIRFAQTIIAYLTNFLYNYFLKRKENIYRGSNQSFPRVLLVHRYTYVESQEKSLSLPKGPCFLLAYSI